jgi:hypothetical protein
MVFFRYFKEMISLLVLLFYLIMSCKRSLARRYVHT